MTYMRLKEVAHLRQRPRERLSVRDMPRKGVGDRIGVPMNGLAAS